MTIFVLKVVAMVTMLIDHYGLALLGNNLSFRSIGRISFPVYAFMLAESFRHIRRDESRVKSHLFKLFILALVSEFPFDLFLLGLDFTRYFSLQSNMLTLLIAYIGLVGFEKVNNRPLIVAVIAILTAACSHLLKTDYPFAGVLLVYSFYWYADTVMNTPKEALISARLYKTDINGNVQFSYFKRALILLNILAIYLLFNFWYRNGFDFSCFLLESFLNPYLSVNSTLLLIPFMLAVYNGEMGYNSPVFRKVFSLFYPLNLIVLGVLEVILGIK